MGLSLWYVWLRQRAPAPLITWLHRWPLLVAISRYLDSRRPLIISLPPPLNGHRAHLNFQTRGLAYIKYEPHVCEVIQDIVKPGWMVIDVGAHIGYFSLLLAKCVGLNGRVFAFEPLPSNVALLRENIALNNYESIVRVEAQAVADASGIVSLHDGPTTSEASIMWYEENTEHAVPAVSLDDYFRPLGFPHVDFLKVDVEGAESLVIAGMETIISQSEPIFLLELHGEVARPGVERLMRAGYELWSVSKQMEIEKRNLTASIGHEHCLAIPRGKAL